jgi:hypothetical protein
MATSNRFLNVKQQSFVNNNLDSRYSNINLNQNHKCSNISSLVQSHSKSKKFDKTWCKTGCISATYCGFKFKRKKHQNNFYCKYKV